MDKLTREVKEFAYQMGADMVGIAGKECFSRLPSVRPDELLPKAQSVVVIGLRMNTNIPSGGSWNYWETYVGRMGLVMHILLRSAYFLEDKGFETCPITIHGSFSSTTANLSRDESFRTAVKNLTITPDGEIQGTEEFNRAYWESMKVLSHRHLAEAAGLGTIGKCRQLVTSRFGPHIVFVSLITDSPLEPDTPLNEPVCPDDCNICVGVCPSGALAPSNLNLAKCLLHRGTPPIDLIKKGDKEAIDRYLYDVSTIVFPWEQGIINALRGGTGNAAVGRSCLLCIKSCPLGKNPKATQQN